MSHFSFVQKVSAFGVGAAVALTYVLSTSDTDQIAIDSNSAVNSNSIEISEVTKTDLPPLPQNPAPTVLPGTQKTEQGYDFDEQMKLKLQKVSDAYEEQIKFPEFSMPIRDGELETKYLADISIADEQPAILGVGGSPTLSIKPNQFRYSNGETITASVTISGLNPNETSAITSELKEGSAVIAYGIATPDAEIPHQFEVTFGEVQLDDVEWKKDLTLSTIFEFKGESYQRSTSIEYVSYMASVEHISNAEVVQSYLEIPVYISTQKPGFHRLRANLYDAESGEALIHLKAEEYLDDHQGILTLKAHITALREAGSEGPYELKDISLQRMPSKPDFITEFGRVDQESVEIDAYRFSQYENTPYSNEKAQRIAKELRRLGS